MCHVSTCSVCRSGHILLGPFMPGPLFDWRRVSRSCVRVLPQFYSGYPQCRATAPCEPNGVDRSSHATQLRPIHLHCGNVIKPPPLALVTSAHYLLYSVPHSGSRGALQAGLEVLQARVGRVNWSHIVSIPSNCKLVSGSRVHATGHSRRLRVRCSTLASPRTRTEATAARYVPAGGKVESLRSATTPPWG